MTFISSKGKGKRGGARVITFYEIIFSISEHIIVMVTIYIKSEKESVTLKEIKSLLSK